VWCILFWKKPTGRYKCEWTCLMNSIIRGNRLGYWLSEILVKFDINYWSPPNFNMCWMFLKF
jgi:hypothetical protein